MVMHPLHQPFGGQRDDRILGGQLEDAHPVAVEQVGVKQLQQVEFRYPRHPGRAHKALRHLTGLLQPLVFVVYLIVEACQHHTVPRIVFFHQAQRLFHRLHAQLAALLDLHIDAVVREGGHQLLQRGRQEHRLIPRDDALGVFYIGGEAPAAVFIGKAHPVTA